MATIALSGQDSIILRGRILSDLADQDCAALTFPNDIADVKTGKNGNSIYALNETGKQCEVVLRVVRGSSDDKWLNNLLSLQNANFPGTVLMVGEFTKNLGNGAGVVTSDTYILSGGIFSKQVEVKSNVEGDTEQSVALYTMKFSNAPRVLT